MQARSFKGSRMSLLAIEDKQPTSQVCKVNLNRKSTLFVQAIYLSKIPKKTFFQRHTISLTLRFLWRKNVIRKCNHGTTVLIYLAKQILLPRFHFELFQPSWRKHKCWFVAIFILLTFHTLKCLKRSRSGIDFYWKRSYQCLPQ